jgi:hypothetical protein
MEENMINRINAKRNLKKKKIIIVLILICIIIVIFSLVELNKNIKFRNEESLEGKSDSEIYKEYVSNRVIPQNIYEFSRNYTGNVSRDELYKQLYQISKYLPKLCKELKATDATKYFNENTELIKEYLGITKVDDFISFAEYIEENDVSGKDFEYCTYEEESLIKDSIYWDFYIGFKYSDMEAVKFKMKILNKLNSKNITFKIFAPED